MTEPQHFKTETSKDKSTTKCVLGIILASVAMFSTRFLGPLVQSMGFDAMMFAVIFRATLAVAFIIALGGKSWLQFIPKVVRSAWKYA